MTYPAEQMYLAHTFTALLIYKETVWLGMQATSDQVTASILFSSNSLGEKQF